MADSWFTQAFGAHYPLLYAHRDEAEAGRCLDLLPRLAPLTGPDGGAVLDLGCGDGRHLARLTAAGCQAVGLDLSAALLDRARQAAGNGSGAPLVRGDMRRLPFRGSAFTAVLSLFTAFGYFDSPAANQAPVREIARVLAGGGHWFLDYLDGDRVRAELGDGVARTRDRDLGPLTVHERRRFDGKASQVVKDVRLAARPGQAAEAARLGIGPAGLRYRERVAVFSLAQLDAMAAAEGLARAAAAGGYEGQPLGEGSRWILVYRKSSSEAVA